MKKEWVIRKILLTFFFCEVMVFTGIEIFNLALRMDIVVSRVEIGIFYFLLPVFTPLFLLIIKNFEEIPPKAENFMHFLSGSLYFIMFVIFQINSWKFYVFSMNLVSVVWFCTVTFSTMSFIFTLGNPNTISMFLTRDNYKLKDKKSTLELAISFIIIIAYLGFVPLLKYPVFFWVIAGFFHFLYGTFLIIFPNEPDQRRNRLESIPQYRIEDIWHRTFPESPKVRRFSVIMDKFFLILLYPASWFIWADFWTAAMHPDIYFNIFYVLFFTPMMYLGWWFYRFEGKHRRISFYLNKHLIITTIILLHFLKLNIIAPFAMGYSLGVLFSTLRQNKFRKRVIVVVLIQILLIAGFGLMLTKWIAPFVYKFGIYITNVLILLSTISLHAVLGIYLHKKDPIPKSKEVTK